MARRRQERRRQAARRAMQRDERRARQQARKRLRRTIYLTVSGVVAILVIVSMGLSSMLRPERSGAGPGEGPGEVFAKLPATHIPEGTTYGEYNSVPPTSGPHWDQETEWGIYTEPVPNERQVHNLEHGGVLIQYKTEDTALISQLEEFAKKQAGYPCYLIVAPYPDMPFTIALTAWGVRDTMETYDEARLQAFVDAYRNKGPEYVPCEPNP